MTKRVVHSSTGDRNGQNEESNLDFRLENNPIEADDPNRPNSCLKKVQKRMSAFCDRRKKVLVISYYAVLLAVYHAYLVAAIVISGAQATVLIVLTVFCWAIAAYYFIYVPSLEKMTTQYICRPISSVMKRICEWKYAKLLLIAAAATPVIIFIAVDTKEQPFRLISAAGIGIFLLIGFIFSTNAAAIKWRPILTGLFVQFCVSLLVLRWPDGMEAFHWISDVMMKFLEHTYVGTAFVYGFIGLPPTICGFAPVLLFTVFQVIIFFGASLNVLYYYGVMQWAVRFGGWIIHVIMGTTAAESVCVVACTFLGMSEAPLIIKPYLAKMTDSELHQIMVSGYATIAGPLFLAYTSFGACREYLLASSIMSAPMSICMSKLFYPETEESQTNRMEDLKLTKAKERSALEAIANGAYAVIPIVGIIGANLVVFIAMVAFLNSMVGWLGELVGLQGVSLERVYSYLFFPLALMMGVSDNPIWADHVNETLTVAELIGTKTVINEFIAYRKMGEFISDGRLTARAQMIATYALCGFSNFASIGIQIGALTEMCPEKKTVIPVLASRALLAGSVSNFMTACFAGLLVSNPATCTPQGSSFQCIDLSASSRCPCNETFDS